MNQLSVAILFLIKISACFKYSLLKSKLKSIYCNIKRIDQLLFSLNILINPLSDNPQKWSNTLKQFVSNSRRIV